VESCLRGEIAVCLLRETGYGDRDGDDVETMHDESAQNCVTSFPGIKGETIQARYQFCKGISVRIFVSQFETTAATAVLLLREWVPGIVTTSRFGPGGGRPNGSLSP
jgi:hypothetical protein